MALQLEAKVVGGWTRFWRSRDSRLIFVSTSDGNDANDGFSDTTPKASISAGLELLRDGYPDWLQLKCGDTFNGDDIPYGGYHLDKGGRSVGEKILITSYGVGARPIINTEGKQFLFVGAADGTPPWHVAIAHLDIRSDTRDIVTQRPHGILIQAAARDILIEGCAIRRFRNGISAQLEGGMIYDLVIRRNVIHDCCAVGVHSQGIYIDEVTGCTIEENVLDHLGWSEAVSGAEPKTIFKHGLYIQGDARDVSVLNNIIADSSATAAQLRSGGTFSGNLCLKNPIGLLMAGDGVASDNVIMDPTDIGTTASLLRRHGIVVQNIVNGAQISGNLIAKATPGAGSKGFLIQPSADDHAPYTLFSVRNLSLVGNVVYGWGGKGIDIGAFTAAGGAQPLENFEMWSNDIQNALDSGHLIRHQNGLTLAIEGASNRLYSTNLVAGNPTYIGGTGGQTVAEWEALVAAAVGGAADIGAQTEVSYADATRTIATYMTSLGMTATHAAFIAEAKLQERSNWRSAFTAQTVNAYLRAGWGL